MAFLKNVRKIGELITLSRQAFGDYKWKIGILMGLGFLSGILGGIGINAVIPLFSVVVGGSEANDVISRYIKSAFLYFNIDFCLKYLLIFIVLLFVLKALVLVIFSYVNVRITTGYMRKTRGKLFRATLEADWPYLLKQKLGHLEKVLMINVQRSRDLFTQISTFIMTLTSLIAYTLVAVNISFLITSITFGFGGLLFFAFKPLIRRVRKISSETEEINRDVAHHINENIVGMKTVKAMSVDSNVLDIGREYFERIRAIDIRAYILGIFSTAFMEPVSVMVIAVLFAVIYKTATFNFVALVAVIYLAKHIFSYITQLQEQVINMYGNVPYLKNVLEYEDEAESHKEQDEGLKSFRFDRAIEFRGVCFSYHPTKEILSDIDFNINKGEMVGLIGPSGAGKTTLVDLILGLLKPTKGRILLDGFDIKQISLRDWRGNIGYVSQDIFLINDTIANNIRFHNESITDKEIEEVAKMANIYEFVQGCPEGFQTIVGERGVRFSAGQRQRIILARVLVRKPKLLILDEATSALDNASEQKIKQVIDNLKERITVFVIAHRLSTVINSDRLLVLDRGRIIEQGSPKDLLSNKDSYFFKSYNLKG